MSKIKPWPDHYPKYKQGCFASWDDSCDMLVGPCACGAWHQQGEFRIKAGELYRNGKKVPSLKKENASTN